MNNLPIGPFSLSATLLVVLVAIFIATLVAGLADRRNKTKNETLVWITIAIGALISRLSSVIIHLEAYLSAPISIIDIRDGGFTLWGAITGVALASLLILRAQSNARKSFVASIIAGLSILAIGLGGLHLLNDMPGKSLGHIALTELDTGEIVQLRDFQGKPIVINLWATWCPPCRREMPVLEKAQQEYADVHFIFANQREPANIIERYLSQESLELQNVVMDSSAVLAQEVDSTGLPTTLFLDAKGRVVDVRLGELSVATLNDHIATLRNKMSEYDGSKESAQ